MSQSKQMSRPINTPLLALIILDGWGINPSREGNAILQASTPTMDRLMQEYPFTQLQASGESVGLPAGLMGNSEVGHLNLGAGRIVYQDITRITKAIRDKSFAHNGPINHAIAQVLSRGSALHLMGLLSDGGVHSHIDHWLASIDLAREKGVNNLYLHPFLDGRDTSPSSGIGFVKTLCQYLRTNGLGRIATLAGRYYAMDRDRRWERVKLAYNAIALSRAPEAGDPLAAIESSYQRGITDEFVVPTVINGQGQPSYPGVSQGDAIIFLNFRADRAREISRAFTEEGFSEFPATPEVKLSSFVCLTEYDKRLNLPVAFPPTEITDILGEIISQMGLRQLRTAETEKYAHVTFFFNGGREETFAGEERILIPSPKDVPTYDLKPQMSARQLTEAAIRKIDSGGFQFLVLNYANPDMVGHTGVLPAAVQACQTVDACLARLIDAIRKNKGLALVTADHGNAEQMVDYQTGRPHTAHTTNPVPFILVDDRHKGSKLREGILADVSPTILSLLGASTPGVMEGNSLLPS